MSGIDRSGRACRRGGVITLSRRAVGAKEMARTRKRLRPILRAYLGSTAAEETCAYS